MPESHALLAVGVAQWIHFSPSVLEKLLIELETLGEDWEPEAKAQLPYLSAICSETLQINPLALICTPRRTLEPLPLAGYDFDAGTILIPCIYLAHRRSEVFPDSGQFKPDRFCQYKFSPYEYLPFGGGSRGCIGMAFSMFEMKLVLITIVSRFQLALRDRRPARPVRRGITIVQSCGVPVMITGDRQS